MIQTRKDFREETQKRRNNSNRVPLLANDYYEEMQKFSHNQSPEINVNNINTLKHFYNGSKLQRVRLGEHQRNVR